MLDRDDVSSVQKISNRRSAPDGCVVQPEPFSPALFSSDPRPPLREQFEEPLARGGAEAALGDQCGDEAGRGYVEGVIGGGAVRRRQADGDAPALLGPAFDVCVTSRGSRRSIGIAAPLSISQSIVGEGSAT